MWDREVRKMFGKRYRFTARILALALAVIFLTGCTAEDISNIISSTVDEIVDSTVDELISNIPSDPGSAGPGDEHWGTTPTSSPSGNYGGSAGPGDEHWGTTDTDDDNITGLGDLIGNMFGIDTTEDPDYPTIELPKPQAGVTVPTLEEDMKGDTYGLLYPKPREAYVGRQYYYHITDEKSFVTAVHDGLSRGIRGIVLQYDEHDYNYWLDHFDSIVNRSEFGGFAKAGYMLEPEENKTLGIYPVFNDAWEAITYYRYREPEPGENAMKVLRAAHELAEEAMKACPGDEYGILLYVNNKICNLATYSDPIPKGIGVPERDATGVFLKGSAVCAGYAVAYRLVLEVLGIESTMIVNNKEAEDPAYHIWNYVHYNGEWRHVDVTWNDSPSDTARNHYFLLTDEELESKTAGSSDAFAHEWVPLYVY